MNFSDQATSSRFLSMVKSLSSVLILLSSHGFLHLFVNCEVFFRDATAV